jgi:Fic family protein
LDRQLETNGLDFTPDLIRAVHRQTTKGLGTPEGPFKPEHEGVWRPGVALVVDPVSGRIMHEGAAAEELEARMQALCDWVELKLTDPINWPPPVIAGVVHYNVVEDHPFADGNGRVARLMSAAVLIRADYVPGRLFNFEAHYGLDKAAYLAALRSVARETLNLETWMRYFLEGLALEYERVAGEVARLGELGAGRHGAAVQLSEAQQRGLSQLQARGLREFNRADYEDAAAVTTSRAQDDLRFLSEQGILERHGDGRARRYRFPSPGRRNPWAGRGGGRPREWTDERIEEELREFTAGETEFPKQARFRSAGRGDLYGAIVKHGGSVVWAGRVGLTPPRRGRPKGPKA